MQVMFVIQSSVLAPCHVSTQLSKVLIGFSFERSLNSQTPASVSSRYSDCWRDNSEQAKKMLSTIVFIVARVARERSMTFLREQICRLFS